MYKPKVGELVKIVADTCGHGIPRGSIVKIASKYTDHSWMVKGRDVYVEAADVVRLNPSLRKIRKNLEKAVRRDIDEVISAHPELKASMREIMRDIMNEILD